ncbi:hypothetical protein [Streptomyces sp. NPDC049887]|uniref:RCC1 domain-containing protein n=1 Tax=Streptomyces sp. NPDC049887 TaxID=3155654 RepID=UPI00343172C2
MGEAHPPGRGAVGRTGTVLAAALAATLVWTPGAFAADPFGGGGAPFAQAWGDNEDGQLGTGDNAGSPVPVAVPEPAGIRSLAAGFAHSLALLEDGTVWAWGDNDNGQLGNGTLDDSTIPVQAWGVTRARAVAAGGDHSLAVVGEGRVLSWGDNFSGQLGNGTNIDSTTPVEVRALTGVTAVAAGLGHSLALAGDGTVWAWGGNASGQLGNGTLDDSTIPVRVRGLRGVTGISTSEDHNLALTSSCGCGHSGLPSGPSCRCGGRPGGLPGGGEDDAGDKVGPGGVVHAWGGNGEGRLGNGATADSNVPVAVTATSGRVGLIAAGGEHSLAG